METDRCVHLEDTTMAWVRTAGDRRLTGMCAQCLFLSLISTSVPSGRLIELTGPVLKLSNVGFFRHTHTMCIHVHREKQKQKYIHKNACTDNTHEQGQPRGKCHSYTQAKQWSLQGDMNLKDWLCAEPWEPQNANNSWKCCHRLVIQICTQLST